jgi:hypothetical protein
MKSIALTWMITGAVWGLTACSNKPQDMSAAKIPEQSGEESITESTDELQLTNSTGSQISGIFGDGEGVQGISWNVTWVRASNMMKAFIYEGNLYRFGGQNSPDDERFKINLTLSVEGSASPVGHLRRDYAALLEAIHRWYRPQSTAPFYAFNHLYLNNLSDEPLYESWLNTSKGSLYFVTNGNSNKIFRWRGRDHNNSELVADFSNARLPFKLLPYLALNPVELTNAFGSRDAILGRQFKGQTRLARCYYAKRYPSNSGNNYHNFHDCNGAFIRATNDFLKDVLFNLSKPFDEYSGVLREALVSESLNARGQLSYLPIAQEPESIVMYSNSPVHIRTDIRGYYTHVGATRGITVSLPFDDPSVSHGLTIVDASSAAANHGTLTISHSGLTWTTALVSVVRPATRVQVGKIWQNGWDGSEVANFELGSRLSFYTSGWASPIHKIMVGRTACKSFRNTLLRGGGEKWARVKSPRSPLVFECLFDTPQQIDETEQLILVYTEDQRVYRAGRARLQKSDAVRAVQVWSAPVTCAEACRFAGGVASLTALEKQNQCRNAATSPEYYWGYRPSAGGEGCVFGTSMGYFNSTTYSTAFNGPENPNLRSVGKFCFCAARSLYDVFEFDSLMRPHPINYD